MQSLASTPLQAHRMTKKAHNSRHCNCPSYLSQLSDLSARLQAEFADRAGTLLDLEPAPLRPRSTKKGRTTCAEEEKRIKSVKEMTKTEAKASTVRVVQAALDGKEGRNTGGAGKGHHPCAYCKQSGHKWTYRGKVTCPQAIEDTRTVKKKEKEQVLRKAEGDARAQERDMARRREEQEQ